MEVLPHDLLLAVFKLVAPLEPPLRWVCRRWRQAADAALRDSRGRGPEELAESGRVSLAAWARAASGCAFSTARANRMLLAAARARAEEMFALVLSWRETVPLLVTISVNEAEALAAAAAAAGSRCRAIAKQARVWTEIAKTEGGGPPRGAGHPWPALLGAPLAARGP